MITGAPDVLVGPDAKQVESEVGQPSCLDVPDHRPAVVRHDVFHDFVVEHYGQELIESFGKLK